MITVFNSFTKLTLKRQKGIYFTTMNGRRLVAERFCKDLEDFLKLYFQIDWPSFVNKNVDNVRKVFSDEIGLAIVEGTVMRHREIYVEDLRFTYSALLRMKRQKAILYIRETALKIRNASVISILIMFSFIGSICVFITESGRPDMAEIPMSVLADIILDDGIGVAVSWYWINEVATMLNQQRLLRIGDASEVDVDPKDVDSAEYDKMYDDIEDEAP